MGVLSRPGDLLGEKNSGRIFCFRIVLAKASVHLKQEKNAISSHPQTTETGLEESGLRVDSYHCVYGEPHVHVPFTCAPHPGRKMNEGPSRAHSTQRSTGTGWPHAVMSVLVWEMGTWIWGCQTLRDPSQLPLSSSKAGLTPALPGGEPATTRSSATLGDIWSPRQWAEIRKRGKGH